MKKKVDERIRTLIENGIRTNTRSFFVIIGDKGRDRIVNLHYMLSKARQVRNPSVVQCYKKDLGFSSHQKKRARQIKREVQRGLRATDGEANPFDLFISSTSIRYLFYRDSDKILGQTFGMAILQDFEALTPNLLARSIETVEGGGILVLLLKTMTSLKQFYQISMDVHNRYRTEAYNTITPRFNERFLLSLGSCKNCVVMDDELNILPISSLTLHIKPNKPTEDEDIDQADTELNILKDEMKETPVIGPLVSICKTLDQAKAVLICIEALKDKMSQQTNHSPVVALTSARGRGKSASLGISLAAAISFGYSNIFLSSPSPENLQAVFEFLLKGFEALELSEHLDYELIQSSNPDFHKAIIRVNVFKEHRQTIQYIQPNDQKLVAQAELVVIDEAAAIPLPIVKKFMSPHHLLFMSSTVNGYEGTGRSLSLKLIKDLRDQTQSKANNTAKTSEILREFELQQPIRYASGDPIEDWLTRLLCLDCSGLQHRIIRGTPHPSKCDLFLVERDTLFSFHSESEAFLARMMSLLVSSHYKNSPNDLQMMADAPSHKIFVLLDSKFKKTGSNESFSLPDILCVILVAMEGKISNSNVSEKFGRGMRAAGDLIPQTISQQFQEQEFARLCGARIVRIAVHPDVQGMKYGSRALELLNAYFRGQFHDLSDERDVGKECNSENFSSDLSKPNEDSEGVNLEPRKNLPPLLRALHECRPEAKLDQIGTSFGLTLKLFNFWKRAGYVPLYIRQTSNKLTGEHSCVMLQSFEELEESNDDNFDEHFSDKTLQKSESQLSKLFSDFQHRFISLLAFDFKTFTSILALSVVNPSSDLISSNINNSANGNKETPEQKRLSLSTEKLRQFVNDYDLKRLQSYSRNLIDYHIIIDLIPALARLFFGHHLLVSGSSIPPLRFSFTQCAILLAMGLQHRSIDDISKELTLPTQQVLALFNKIVVKVTKFFCSIHQQEICNSINQSESVRAASRINLKPIRESLKSEIGRASKAVEEEVVRTIEEFKKNKIDINEEAVTCKEKKNKKSKMKHARNKKSKRQKFDEE